MASRIKYPFVVTSVRFSVCLPTLPTLLIHLPIVCSFLAGLKRYFAEKVAAMTKRRGLRMQVCEDFVFDGKNRPFNLKRFNDKIMVVARRNIWELGKAHQAYRLANNDYMVCNIFHIVTELGGGAGFFAMEAGF